MLKTIINYFRRDASAFQERSKNILGVFTQASQNLRELNQEIINQRAVLAERKAKIELEDAAMKSSLQENQKVIDNISKFLGNE